MTLFAKLYTDILGDPKLMSAARKGARHLVNTPWLIIFAKLADDDGRLSINGERADPIDIAALIPGVTAHQVDACEVALEALGVLVRDEDGVLRFAAWEWRAGGGKPSDTPEAVRERVARHRARKRGRNADGNASDVTPGNAIEKEQEEETEPDQEQKPEQEERERAALAASVETLARTAFGEAFADVERFLATRKPHHRADWLRSMLKVIGPGSQYTAADIAGACADALIADPPVKGPHALRAFAEKRRQERNPIPPSERTGARRSGSPIGILSASDAYVDKILALVQQGPTLGSGVSEFIPKREVVELGPPIVAAYDAVGGATAFIAAKNDPVEKLFFLRRDFARAFADAINVKPAKPPDAASGGGG